jgi:hypothetical protein
VISKGENSVPPSKATPPHLQLVKSPVVPAVPTGGAQLSLQLEPRARMFVVNMTQVSKRSFVAFVSQAKPKVLFDLRPVPNFDIDSFSRRLAFRLFEQFQVHYFDLAAILDIKVSLDATVASGRAVECMSKILSDAGMNADGIGVLLEAHQCRVWLSARLYEKIVPRPQSGWNLENVPATASGVNF